MPIPPASISSAPDSFGPNPIAECPLYAEKPEVMYFPPPPDEDTTFSAMDCISSSVGMPVMSRFPSALVSERMPFEIDPLVTNPDSQVATRDSEG